MQSPGELGGARNHQQPSYSHYLQKTSKHEIYLRYTSDVNI
jgi:hypothetical protein